MFSFFVIQTLNTWDSLKNDSVYTVQLSSIQGTVPLAIWLGRLFISFWLCSLVQDTITGTWLVMYLLLADIRTFLYALIVLNTVQTVSVMSMHCFWFQHIISAPSSIQGPVMIFVEDLALWTNPFGACVKIHCRTTDIRWINIFKSTKAIDQSTVSDDLKNQNHSKNS